MRISLIHSVSALNPSLVYFHPSHATIIVHLHRCVLWSSIFTYDSLAVALRRSLAQHRAVQEGVKSKGIMANYDFSLPRAARAADEFHTRPGRQGEKTTLNKSKYGKRTN